MLSVLDSLYLPFAAGIGGGGTGFKREDVKATATCDAWGVKTIPIVISKFKCGELVFICVTGAIHSGTSDPNTIHSDAIHINYTFEEDFIGAMNGYFDQIFYNDYQYDGQKYGGSVRVTVSPDGIMIISPIEIDTYSSDLDVVRTRFQSTKGKAYQLGISSFWMWANCKVSSSDEGQTVKSTSTNEITKDDIYTGKNQYGMSIHKSGLPLFCDNTGRVRYEPYTNTVYDKFYLYTDLSTGVFEAYQYKDMCGNTMKEFLEIPESPSDKSLDIQKKFTKNAVFWFNPYKAKYIQYKTKPEALCDEDWKPISCLNSEVWSNGDNPASYNPEDWIVCTERYTLASIHPIKVRSWKSQPPNRLAKYDSGFYLLLTVVEDGQTVQKTFYTVLCKYRNRPYGGYIMRLDDESVSPFNVEIENQTEEQVEAVNKYFENEEEEEI